MLNYFNSKIGLVSCIFNTYPLTILTSSSETSSYSSSNPLYSSSSSYSSSDSVLAFFLCSEVLGVVDFFLYACFLLLVLLLIFLLACLVDLSFSSLVCFLVLDFLMYLSPFLCFLTFSLPSFDSDYLKMHK